MVYFTLNILTFVFERASCALQTAELWIRQGVGYNCSTILQPIQCLLVEHYLLFCTVDIRRGFAVGL